MRYKKIMYLILSLIMIGFYTIPNVNAAEAVKLDAQLVDSTSIDETLTVEGPINISDLSNLFNESNNNTKCEKLVNEEKDNEVKTEISDSIENEGSTTPSAISVEIILSYDGNEYTFEGQNNNHNVDNIYKTTEIDWDYNVIGGSNDDVANIEWINQKSSYNTYEKQTVKLRILDKNGYWSKFTDVSFNITNRMPVAGLKYLIMNPDSLKNGKITTDTQIAWLWSYGNESYTYDPDGDSIASMNISGISQQDIIGNLTGNIGFATQFSVPAQYIMEFKCADSEGLWSNVFKIAIDVEPADSNHRPECVINYSPTEGPLETQFTFNYGNCTDSDGDEITNLEYKVLKEGVVYPTNKISVVQDGSNIKLKFNEFGLYDVYFRVSDSKGAWSNWGIATVEVKDIKNTPNGESIKQAWLKIKANTQNMTGHEAFERSIPKSSKYIGYTIVKGVKQYYYLMTFEDKYKYTSDNYLTQYDSYVVYNQDYRVPNPYHNGYYGAWYPGGKIKIDKGIFSAEVGYQKYNFTSFGEYRRLHLFDFIYGKDYTVEYSDHFKNKPYFVSYKMSDDDVIVYGRSYWFSDGSGHSSLTRINRSTGAKFTNNNVVFASNSEVESGIKIDNNRYAFISTQNGKQLTILDINNVQVIKMLPVNKVYNLSLDTNGDILLISGHEKLVVDKDTLTFK